MQVIFMIVYNKIENDARVQRAARALSKKYSVKLYAIGKLEDPDIDSIPSKSCKSMGGVIAYLKFVIDCVYTAIKHKPDIIYAHDIFAALPLLLIKFFGKSRLFIYDAHELFIKQKNTKISFDDRILYAIEGRAIKTSDLVICAHEKRGEIMKDYHKLKKTPVTIRNISCFSCANESLPSDVYEQCKEFFDIQAFFVIYAGGLLFGRKLDILIDAVDRLGDEYKLLLVGNGPAAESLRSKIDNLNNANIKIISAVPYASLAALLKKADAGYIYYSTEQINTLYCAPNKIYEYASVSLPIISNNNPTVKHEIDKFMIGYCDDEIINAIKYVKENADNLKRNIDEFVRLNNEGIIEKELLLEMENLISGK